MSERERVLTQWVDAYGDRLYRQALFKVGDEGVAADLVQETFIAAWQQWAHFKGRSTPSTWLHGILNHKIIDWWRKHKEWAQDPCQEGDTVEETLFDARGHWVRPVQRWDPEQACCNEAFWTWLQRCLAQLPPQQAAVFRLESFSAQSPDAICGTLGIKPGHFRVLLHRARLRIRACLEAAGITPED